MHNWYFFLLPLVSAFSGWLSVWILFQLFFYPREPRTILGLKVHGLFPKWKAKLPRQLGEFIGNELSSVSSFSEIAGNPENLKPILPLIENHIDDFLRNKLAVDIPMVAMFVGDKTIGLLKQSFLREMQVLFPEVMQEYAASLHNRPGIQGLVEEKIKTLAEGLEAKLEKDLRKQFISISLIGAIAGLICGLIFIGLIAIL